MSYDSAKVSDFVHVLITFLSLSAACYPRIERLDNAHQSAWPLL